MKFKRYVIIISSTILTFLISGIIGFTQENNFEKQETALRIIKDFANDFCQDPNLKLSGHEDNLELSGKAKAEINNLIKKLVDIGIEGAAKYSEHYYEGVLQKDLAEMLRNEHECKMKIWDDLEKKLMPPLPEKETKPKYNENKENVEETIWKIDDTGVCRDNDGYYPRWTAYNWNLKQCADACLRNLNCQGFAMSKTQNYCQLMGSDGSRSASKPGTRITRGDSSQPKYTCYLKR